MFFNEEWNERDTDTDGGDVDFIDNVDCSLNDINDNDDYDDGGYEEYGN